MSTTLLIWYGPFLNYPAQQRYEETLYRLGLLPKRLCFSCINNFRHICNLLHGCTLIYLQNILISSNSFHLFPLGLRLPEYSKYQGMHFYFQKYMSVKVLTSVNNRIVFLHLIYRQPSIPLCYCCIYLLHIFYAITMPIYKIHIFLS